MPAVFRDVAWNWPDLYYDRDRGGDHHSNDDKGEDIENHDLLRLFRVPIRSRTLSNNGSENSFFQDQR
jgi:hypothetical protein